MLCVSFGLVLCFVCSIRKVFGMVRWRGLGLGIMVVLVMVGCLISIFFSLNGLIW